VGTLVAPGLPQHENSLAVVELYRTLAPRRMYPLFGELNVMVIIGDLH